MESTNRSEKNFFEEFGLEVAHGEVELGKTYPIFGMITSIISDKLGEVVAEINYSIKAKMNIVDNVKVDLLKERAFESGIFVCTVMAKEPQVEVECQTVIFGRKQGFNA